MMEREEDLLLRRALLDALRLDWEEILEAAPPAVQSPRQQNRMRTMLANPVGYARRAARPLWKKAARRAAAVFLACTLTLGSLLAASPTIRAAFFLWVTEWYETHIIYRAGEMEAAPLPDYRPAWLPEGYEETDVFAPFGNQVAVTYENAAGDEIFFQYQNDGAILAGTEMTIWEFAEVNETPADFYRAKDPSWGNDLIWVDQESGVVFSLDARMEKNVIIHMAESVILEDSTIFIINL